MKVHFFCNRFRPVLVIFAVLISLSPLDANCQAGVRTEIKIPNIPGYLTLKCDFHMHTVFSDGKVWPTIRAEEAWREGLDAFAITDHIEHQPHKADISTNHNRPYEIARKNAAELRLIIIKGAEITRKMPPGHLNAIFLNNIDPLDTKDWKDAIKAAVDQNAFIFWNHPGWAGQQPDGKSLWYPEHTELYKKGWMHGIEIVNENAYYPLAHRWALEKKLTMMGGSDVHNPTNLDYNLHQGEHRSVTLVFAEAKTEEAIKEALLARRTAVYWKNTLIGEEKYLKPIFNESIETITPEVTIKGKSKTNIQIRNKSQIDFELAANGPADAVSAPQNITLWADKTVSFRIRGKAETLSGRKKIRVPYMVKNLLIAPDKGLQQELNFTVNFVPVQKR